MELDSGADSVSSTPRSIHHHKLAADDRAAAAAVVRLMCSFGGKILPRPHDNQLRYIGGDTRIVAIPRSTSFSSLLSKLSKLSGAGTGAGAGDFTVKYQLPNEDLDALITVSTDEDVENMMEEFERLIVQSNNNRIPRLRLFLFPNTGGNDDDSRTSSIASLLDGSRKRENWFLDALNGGGVPTGGGPPAGSGDGGGLERGRSEASSIVSEVPDYLFGLENPDEKFKNRTGFSDLVGGSAPGSPALPVSASPFGSTSSAPAMPNLPPVKTRLENPVEDAVEPAVQQAIGYNTGGPVWSHHNTNNPGSPFPVHTIPSIPVYYVPASPGPGPIARGNAHIQPVPVPVQVPIPGPFLQQYGPGPSSGPVQVPVGYPGSGPMYGHGSGGLSQPLYYGVKNAGMVAAYPGMVMPMAGDDVDPTKGRTHQG